MSFKRKYHLSEAIGRYLTISFINLYADGLATQLLRRNQCCAAAHEGVKDGLALFCRFANQILDQWDGLLAWVKIEVTLSYMKAKHRCLSLAKHLRYKSHLDKFPVKLPASVSVATTANCRTLVPHQPLPPATRPRLFGACKHYLREFLLPQADENFVSNVLAIVPFYLPVIAVTSMFLEANPIRRISQHQVSLWKRRQNLPAIPVVNRDSVLFIEGGHHLSLPNRFSQSTLDRPASVQAVPERALAHSVLFGPFCKTQSAAIEGNEPIRPFVSRLLALSSPSAVAGFIVAVIVDAVDAVAIRRTWPHVIVKRLERGSPSFAYRHAASAVQTVIGAILVVAASNHQGPHIVFSGVLQAVSPETRPSFFSLEASATASGLSSRERRSCDNTFTATVAQAVPGSPAVPVAAGKRYGDESAEPLARQVFEVVRAKSRIVHSHDGTPNTRSARATGQYDLSGCSHSMGA